MMLQNKIMYCCSRIDVRFIPEYSSRISFFSQVVSPASFLFSNQHNPSCIRIRCTLVPSQILQHPGFRTARNTSTSSTRPALSFKACPPERHRLRALRPLHHAPLLKTLQGAADDVRVRPQLLRHRAALERKIPPLFHEFFVQTVADQGLALFGHATTNQSLLIVSSAPFASAATYSSMQDISSFLVIFLSTSPAFT